MDTNALDRHRSILAWCFIAAGAFLLLMSLIAMIIIVSGGWFAGDPEGRRVLAIISASIAAFVVIFAVPALITGVGLLKRKYWAKVLALIIGLLHVASFPLGTALFIYTLWFWLQPNSEALFHRRGTPPRVGPPRPPEQPPVGPGWPERQPT